MVAKARRIGSFSREGGQDLWVVESVADMVRRQGPQGLSFKSDQEPSILDMKNKVVAELWNSHEVIMEASPVNEHQSSSVVERGGSDSWRKSRIHKLALEQSYSKELEAGHVVIPWLIMHAAVMVSLF